jgi:hypothetical protein
MPPDLPTIVNDGNVNSARSRPNYSGKFLGSAWILLLLVIPASVIDLAIPFLVAIIREQNPESVIVYSGMGIIAAQVALISMMLVFGTEQFWQRFFVHWVVAVLLVTCCVAVSHLPLVANPDTLERNVLRLYGSLPLVSLLIQLPLWFARVVLGWQFERRTQPPNPKATPRTQMAISDLFTATAVVAVTLGITRVAPISSFEAGTHVTVWFGIGMFGAAAMGVSCFSILPAMFIFSGKIPVSVCWVLTLGYAFFLELLFLVLVFSGIVGFNRELTYVIGYTAITFWFAAGIASGLTLLRWNHMYVQRGRG